MSDKKGSSTEKVLHCSFCGKNQHEVKKLIAGPSVFICDECIDLCNDIIRDEVPAEGASSKPAKSDLPTPSEIKGSLDQYVIGQDAAKPCAHGAGNAGLNGREHPAGRIGIHGDRDSIDWLKKRLGNHWHLR